MGTTGGSRQAGDRADGLSIRHDGRPIRLKWHKLRRGAGDPPFHRPNLDAGLAAGASMEVDIQLLADGAFVCLHDENLETETDGSGPVGATDSATVRTLRQTADGAAGAPPLLLEELADIISGRAADIGDGGSVQLDLKSSGPAITGAVADRFARTVQPVARHLSLSGEDWQAVVRLGGAVEGLSLGFDPTVLAYEDRDTVGDLSGFAERVASLAPRADTVYLHHSVFAAARRQGVDLAGAFHHLGRRVDCWTISTDRDGAEMQLRLAIDSGVDQVTTDTPADLQALWAAMPGGRG